MASIVNLLETPSLVVVWLSDQKNWRQTYMYSRLVRTIVPAAAARAIVGFWLLVFLLTVVYPVRAQSTAGRILGTVADQSGPAVASAKVVITDLERGTSRTLTTDEAGAYVAADLTPGTYKIQAEAKGFKTVQRPSV